MADAANMSKGLFEWFGHHHADSEKFVLYHNASSKRQLGQVDRFCDELTGLVKKTTGAMALHTHYFDFAARCTWSHPFAPPRHQNARTWWNVPAPQTALPLRLPPAPGRPTTRPCMTACCSLCPAVLFYQPCV